MSQRQRKAQLADSFRKKDDMKKERKSSEIKEPNVGDKFGHCVANFKNFQSKIGELLYISIHISFQQFKAHFESYFHVMTSFAMILMMDALLRFYIKNIP